MSEVYAAEFKNVSYTYNKGIAYEKHAVKNVSLALKQGVVTGIIGSTGSGKSTLIKMLNGLLKPDSGEIIVDGENIWDKKVKMRDVRFKVGLVMQYPEYQLFDDTVSGDISFGPKNMGVAPEMLRERVLEAARFAGLDEDLLEKSPFDLSGGQRRRAALAGVIAMRPSLLVLDEPAAGLDPAGRREILGRIKKYQRENGNTVVIVSHSMEDVAKYCDRLAVMNGGEIFMCDDTEKVFERGDELRAMGLDVPEITKIAAVLDELGVGIGKDVYTVKYAAERLIEKYSLNN
ncbi:MAG: energy-coupling factor transporter ATPase [Clostridia bacterium]|nr:energy-coupling factor transporter ATPase [Clostridia bacterium]